MSRTTVNIYSEFDSLRIECQDDEPVIWIRGDEACVSLSLSKADRIALRKALEEADASEHSNWIIQGNADADSLPAGCDGCREEVGGRPICCVNQIDEE